MTKKTLRGEGLRLELDRNEVVPDDPGAGTPAMVYKGDASGTFWCVFETGELLGSRAEPVKLTRRQLDWLDDQWDEVDRFLKQ